MGWLQTSRQPTDRQGFEIKECSYDLLFFPLYPVPLQFALGKEYGSVQPLQTRLWCNLVLVANPATASQLVISSRYWDILRLQELRKAWSISPCTNIVHLTRPSTTFWTIPFPLPQLIEAICPPGTFRRLPSGLKTRKRILQPHTALAVPVI
jgi:hypothetical protein